MKTGLGVSIGSTRPRIFNQMHSLGGVMPAMTLDFENGIYGLAERRTLESIVTVNRTTGQTVVDADLARKWSLHNLFYNSATGVTQTVSVDAGYQHTVGFKGTGSITFSTGATGTLSGTGVNDLVTTNITPTAGVVCTVSGSITEVRFYRSDLGGMQLATDGTDYLETGGAAGYALGVTHSSTGAALGAQGYEGRTNLYLNTLVPATQSITVDAVPHVLSFWGTGTVTLSGTSTAGPLVGTGANDRVELGFTPTAGTLTLTLSGTISMPQLEAGDTVTPFIPTGSSAVSRSADNTQITLSDINFSATGGTLICVFQSDDLTGRAVTLHDGGTNELIGHYNSSGNNNFRIDDGGVGQANLTAGVHTAGAESFIAMAWAANDVASSVDGGPTVNDTTVTLPTVTTMNIGQRNSANKHLNGTIKKLLYYPVRLDDALLILAYQKANYDNFNYTSQNGRGVITYTKTVDSVADDYVMFNADGARFLNKGLAYFVYGDGQSNWTGQTTGAAWENLDDEGLGMLFDVNINTGGSTAFLLGPKNNTVDATPVPNKVVPGVVPAGTRKPPSTYAIGTVNRYRRDMGLPTSSAIFMGFANPGESLLNIVGDASPYAGDPTIRNNFNRVAGFTYDAIDGYGLTPMVGPTFFSHGDADKTVAKATYAGWLSVLWADRKSVLAAKGFSGTPKMYIMQASGDVNTTGEVWDCSVAQQDHADSNSDVVMVQPRFAHKIDEDGATHHSWATGKEFAALGAYAIAIEESGESWGIETPTVALASKTLTLTFSLRSGLSLTTIGDGRYAAGGISNNGFEISDGTTINSVTISGSTITIVCATVPTGLVKYARQQQDATSFADDYSAHRGDICTSEVITLKEVGGTGRQFVPAFEAAI